MPERVVSLAGEVKDVADQHIREIQSVTEAAKFLALNAGIEAARAGENGRTFSVVAKEVSNVAAQIRGISEGLTTELAARLVELDDLGRQLVEQVRGTRLADLALNMIEIIDRNLYERSCDVRWWATDSAVVEACARPTDHDAATFASHRLGVILDSYTVYLDLWVADASGNVIAHGRPDKYPSVIGTNVASQAWFRDAIGTSGGDQFAVCDIEANPALDGAAVATYSTAIRRGGDTRGEPIGALGIFFDWEGQATDVVHGVRLTDGERGRTRCLLVDAAGRIIAASDQSGVLTETFDVATGGQSMGFYTAHGSTVGFALTPGYETYRGLGWYGVLVQEPA